MRPRDTSPRAHPLPPHSVGVRGVGFCWWFLSSVGRVPSTIAWNCKLFEVESVYFKFQNWHSCWNSNNSTFGRTEDSLKMNCFPWGLTYWSQVQRYLKAGSTARSLTVGFTFRHFLVVLGRIPHLTIFKFLKPRARIMTPILWSRSLWK